MSDEIIGGAVIGGVAGAAVAGLPGALVGGALGGLLGDAYSKKPEIGNFATTLQNDLAPENVTLDAHQIYLRITTGHGTSTLAAANAAATRLSGDFAERANQIARALGAAAGAWQGNASTSAAAATTPLAGSFAVARRQLAANAQALDAEVAAFDHIRSQVEPVPATPPHSGLANDVNPFQTDTDAAINEYNAKAAKNVRLYEAYVAETAAARSQVPRGYAQPTPLGAAGAALTRTASPVEAASVPPPVVGAAGAGRPAATGASAAGDGPAAPPSTTGASGGTPGATAGQGIAATDATARPTPSVTTPSATTPGGVPLLPATGNAYTSGPLAGPPRRTGTADARRGFGAAGPGVGASGGVGVFGGGAGAGGGAGSRPGPSVTTGPVPGQVPPDRAVGRGGAGGLGGPAARGAGPGGLPLGAAGRSTDEEDQEHRRKYRVEPDDDELFGLDEPYVPSVIGDRR